MVISLRISDLSSVLNREKNLLVTLLDAASNCELIKPFHVFFDRHIALSKAQLLKKKLLVIRWKIFHFQVHLHLSQWITECFPCRTILIFLHCGKSINKSIRIKLSHEIHDFNAHPSNLVPRTSRPIARQMFSKDSQACQFVDCW